METFFDKMNYAEFGKGEERRGRGGRNCINWIISPTSSTFSLPIFILFSSRSVSAILKDCCWLISLFEGMIKRGGGGNGFVWEKGKIERNNQPHRT
jgi:hypothetical protein